MMMMMMKPGVCPLTLEAALVAVWNGEGALLHGQLVKFGELRKQKVKCHVFSCYSMTEQL